MSRLEWLMPSLFLSLRHRGFDGRLLDALVALADDPDEGEGAEADEQVGGLDEPVQVADEKGELGDAKSWDDEGIDDADGSQQPQAACEHCNDAEGEQGESDNKAEDHMEAS